MEIIYKIEITIQERYVFLNKIYYINMLQRLNTNKRQLRKCHSKNLSQIKKVQINLKNPSEEHEDNREISNLRKIIRQEIRYQFQEFNQLVLHKPQEIENIKIQLQKFKYDLSQNHTILQNLTIKQSEYNLQKQQIAKKINSIGIVLQSIDLTKMQEIMNKTKQTVDQNVQHNQTINNIFQTIRQLEKKNRFELEKITKKIIFMNESYTNTIKKLTQHIQNKFTFCNKQIAKLKGNKQNIRLKRNASQNFPRIIQKQKFCNQQIQNNQNLYYIDESGFLLDQKNQYILNEKQQPIVLSQQQIEVLKSSEYIRTQ